jgi:hypothetical protein
MRVRTVWGVLLLLGGLLVTTAGPAEAQTTFDVSPSTGLHDYQRVQVTITGAVPGASVGWCQYPNDDPDPGPQCISSRYFGLGTANGAGSVFGELRVRRVLERTWNGVPVDCAAAEPGCTIGWGYVSDLQTLGTVPLEFAPVPPPPVERGTIEVSPTSGLPDAADLTVQGEGFRPSAPLVIFQCRLDLGFPAGCMEARNGLAWSTDADGRFTAMVTVFADGSVVGAPFGDCRSSPCSIAVAEAIDVGGTAVVGPALLFDPPPVRILPGHAVLHEGDPAQSSVLVLLSRPADHEVRVGWETVASGQPTNPATPGVDYEPASGVAVFPVGTTSVALPVVALDDPLDEPYELLAVRLHDAVGATLDAPEHTFDVLVEDDDRTPTIVPGAAQVMEGDAEGGTLVVPVFLDQPSAATISARWQTLAVGGLSLPEATPESDYVPSAGFAVFPPGQTMATVEIPVVGDAAPEPGELVVLSFDLPEHAALGGFWGLGFGGIADDDS